MPSVADWTYKFFAFIYISIDCLLSQVLEIIYLICHNCNLSQIAQMVGANPKSVIKVMYVCFRFCQVGNVQERQPLGGQSMVVECDETLWGSTQKGVHGKPAQVKACYWAVFERGSGKFIIETMNGNLSMRKAPPKQSCITICYKVGKQRQYCLHRWLSIPKIVGNQLKHAYVNHNEGEFVAKDPFLGH